MSGVGLRPSAALADGLGSLFYCWVRKTSPGYVDGFYAANPEEFLRADWRMPQKYPYFAVEEFVKPAGVITVSLRSRQVFENGLFVLEATLPAPTPGGPMLWFGFEVDDLFRGGVAHFLYHWGTGSLLAYVGGGEELVEVDLTEFLPPDYSAARHTYSVQLKPNMVIHYVDGYARAITVLARGSALRGRVVYDGAPTKMAVTTSSPPASMPILIDVDGGDTSKEWRWRGIHPWLIRAMNSSPSTAFCTPLFAWGSGAPLRGYRVERGSVTSTPVPGIGRKTIGIVADTSGTVELEATAGDEWILCDSYRAEAGKWLWLTPEADAYFYRVRYTPSSYPASIRDAHACVI